MRALPFVGIDELHGRPHVMVDGAQRDGSVEVLSHWPVTTTPPEFARDLSTEIVFFYLENDLIDERAMAVTCDHFDEDGLASVFTLVDPSYALADKQELIEIARIGDFGVIRDDTALQVVLAVQALSDRKRSPLFSDVDSNVRYNAWTSLCYEALLSVFRAVIASPSRYESLFHEHEVRVHESMAAFSDGRITIDEDESIGLAIVRCDESVLNGTRFALSHGTSLPVHEWAINSNTAMPRVLVIDLERPCFYDRYETWVRYSSRSLPLRRDMTPLAMRLTEQEPNGTLWSAEAASSLTPVLAPSAGAPSAIGAFELIELVAEHLRTAEVAWDPFAQH